MVKVKVSEVRNFEQRVFSSNLIIFDQSETRFEHWRGKLVKYDNKSLVIGGDDNAEVEEMGSKQLWAENPMSPVNDYDILEDFTALPIDKSLFIFGIWCLLK